VVPLRCLIVDDNASFTAVAQTILEGAELTVIGVAATASEGLQRARELVPDVVVLDIDLGTDSGFDVAEELARQADHDVPNIVLISGHPEDDFADLIEESPALGFVAKSELSAAAIARLVRDEGTTSDKPAPRDL
jgi:DNA-binding NarL/FixJ family response regulator